MILPIFVGIKFLLDVITDHPRFEACTEGECVDYIADIRSMVDWPSAMAIPGCWENTSGSFEPYTWGLTKTWDKGQSEATLSLTLEASY
ncbi:MAG: hypothetical protein IH621_18080 [Krumholzibacteria bacterium]|nr:hypothetical protein [Candidatus Krumholzibacteria bacterium]